MKRAMLALAGLLALAACKSPEEKLLERRQALRAALDELHQEYRAERAAGNAGAEGGEPGQGAGLMQRLASELDRSGLEQHCLATGRGERGFALSDRLEDFVREHARACREAARLEAEVATLEREVAGRGDRAPR